MEVSHNPIPTFAQHDSLWLRIFMCSQWTIAPDDFTCPLQMSTVYSLRCNLMVWKIGNFASRSLFVWLEHHRLFWFRCFASHICHVCSFIADSCFAHDLFVYYIQFMFLPLYGFLLGLLQVFRSQCIMYIKYLHYQYILPHPHLWWTR